MGYCRVRSTGPWRERGLLARAVNGLLARAGNGLFAHALNELLTRAGQAVELRVRVPRRTDHRSRDRRPDPRGDYGGHVTKFGPQVNSVRQIDF